MAGLYIHIPFCHSKCYYCDFYSTPSLKLSNRAVDALVREMQLRKAELPAPIDTVYLGGGTPSILTDEQIKSIIGGVRRLCEVSQVREFTIEANPEDINKEKVALWRSLGINRVSMGLQSLVDSELKAIGRRHTAQQGLEAVERIAEGGISNTSLDLIYGLPGQTLESWDASLTAMLRLGPSHFSAYMLSYEPNTRLTLKLKKGEIAETDENTLVEMYHLLCQRAKEHGYAHYEISNFAKPGNEAKHNSAYWHGVPYLGIGPSAHSFDGKVRRINPASLSAYLQRIERNECAYEIDAEDDNNKFNDLIITALRTADGLPLASVPVERLERLMTDAAPMLKTGLLRIADNKMSIPEDAWLVSDSIISTLFQV